MYSSENAAQAAKVQSGCHLPERREDLVADTLSRAYLPEVNSRIFVREMEEVDHSANLPVSDERSQQLTHVCADDPVLK